MTTALVGSDSSEYLTDREYLNGKRQWQVQYSGGGVSLTDDRRPPQWMALAIAALTELYSLSANWDTYGAQPIDPACAKAVLKLLQEVMQEETPLPAFVPTSRGGIQLEWHTRGINLEVEFLTPVRIQGLYENLRSGSTWEEELSSNLTPLASAIAQLSE